MDHAPCAPAFFLLTGTGAFLARGRRSTAELSRFLFVRGVWLIVLELTVIRCLGMQFNFDYQVTMLIVIWALGWAMIGLAALVWLPVPAILVVRRGDGRRPQPARRRALGASRCG